jgi:putative multiple sugar transport system ATP-binding protein
MHENILEMKNIIKDFPGVRALDHVNFCVRRGEIHCLVGENGAGKSTLMKVLSGVYPYGSYEGDIVFDGEVQKFKSISDSENNGIGIIYQELALVPELTIYENIYFGHEIKKGRSIDWDKTIIESKKMLNKVKLEYDPSEKVKHLGVGHQQLVEIAKALSKNVKLLILDEPTAALHENDSKNLLTLVKELKKQGVTCIMISHKLKEVRAIADTITILRDGATICSIDCKDCDVSESTIIKNMVGREMSDIYPKRENTVFGDVIFQLKDWTVFDQKKNREILHKVDMNVRRGEIVGLQGLMGAGRTELALSIFGNTPGYNICDGQLTLNGKNVVFESPKDAIEAGLAYVSEDRKGNGLVLMHDVKYNISIANIRKLVQGISINKNEEIKIANKYKKALNIKTPTIEQKVLKLSGGNQQKVQLAKWMFVEPDVLILDEPTRGIDVGAKFEIYTLMNQLVESGMSIIMITSELPEALGMSDRIYVMSEGTITGEFSAEEATEHNIMEMAIKTDNGRI